MAYLDLMIIIHRNNREYYVRCCYRPASTRVKGMNRFHGKLISCSSRQHPSLYDSAILNFSKMSSMVEDFQSILEKIPAIPLAPGVGERT